LCGRRAAVGRGASEREMRSESSEKNALGKTRETQRNPRASRRAGSRADWNGGDSFLEVRCPSQVACQARLV
jgi:hypothetical protein